MVLELPIQRIGMILHYASDGEDLNTLEVNMVERDEISHGSLLMTL